MSEFKREERFIVIKRKNLRPIDERELHTWLQQNDIQTCECVVVESDWPEYEQVWSMIEARVTGAATPSEDGREVPEVVKLQHMAVAEDSKLRWMTGRKIGECELYAAPDFGSLREPLMTVAQHSRIVAAKDAEIARARSVADKLAAERAELLAQPARQVGADARRTLGYGIKGNSYMLKTTRAEIPDVYTDDMIIELVDRAALAPDAVDQWAPSECEYDRCIHQNPDAKAWADLFVATFPGLIDKHDLMIGWFANAMMAMHDWLKSQEAAPAAVATDADIETAAQLIYTQWDAVKGYVPWVKGGNSNQQDYARKLARDLLSRLNRRAIPEALLERIAAHLEWDGAPPMDTIQYAYKCDELAAELRALLG